MVDPLLASYEAVPYESRAISSCDIGRLEAVARLHGITPPPAGTARILELACASGGNLIPMAYRFRDARFLGIDLTPGQIAAGQRTIAELGLTNVSLQVMNITDITDDLGMFDYIIAHGVYSWVPPDVQEATLRVCRRNLSPNGVAYVSYNTYPGWHAREMVRNMMIYHDDPSLSPTKRVSRAASFIELLSKHGNEPDSLHSRELAGELEILKAQADAYSLHEQFEAYNAPVYFSEFVRRASSTGLQYLAEATLVDQVYVPPQWAEDAVGPEADRIRVQQYVDFAIGRQFRRSVLCHDGLTPNRRPDASRITSLCVALLGHRTASASTAPDAESYDAPHGATMTTSSRETLAAFRVLERITPASLTFAELYRRTCDLLSIDAPPGTSIPAGLSSALADTLLTCAFGGLIDITSHASKIQGTATERPVASRAARAMVSSTNFTPNLFHAPTELSPLARVLLPLLDGSNDRAQLVRRVNLALDAGTFAPSGARPAQAELEQLVDATLGKCARAGLLEA